MRRSPRAEPPNLHYFEVTSQRGPGDVGTVFGDLVYHNFYATRFNATSDRTLDRVVAAEEPAERGTRHGSGIRRMIGATRKRRSRSTCPR